MSSEIKIGLIGLDTSHVTAFTGLLNNPEAAHRVPGGKIVAAFPGGSPDLSFSVDRIDGFTAQVRDTYGVEILSSPQAVAESCDAILMTAVDGRAHLKLFEEVAPYRKPTFIDKPFAVSSADALAIAEIAGRQSVPLMSCSLLRYSDPLADMLSTTSRDEIIGMDVTGPLDLQPSQNDLFWYGIHCAELLFSVMGQGCRQVAATESDEHIVLAGLWEDGCIGTMRGDLAAKMAFNITLHTRAGSRFAAAYSDTRPVYVPLLEKIMEFFRSRESPIPIAETLEIMRFLEAANESRAAHGAPRPLRQN